MSEENSVSENSVELPIQDVSAWKQAASQLLEPTDGHEYTSDAKGIERATEDRVRRRRETLNDAGPEAPTIRHVGKDSKSPWKMADDVAFSKQLATSEQVFADNPTMSSQELFDATEEALHPSPTEIKLDDKELGRWEGKSQPEIAQELKNWRERQAQEQAQELAQLQNEQAEREAWEAREQEQAQQSAAEQEAQAKAAQEYEAQQRHLNAERARVQQLQQLQHVEQQARAEAAQLFAYGQANFSDIASPEQIEHLRRTDPARHRALMLLNQKAGEVMRVINGVEQHKRSASDEAMAQQKAARAAQREAIIAQQDQAAADAIRREIPDTDYGEIQKAAREVLLKTGISEAALVEHWNGKPVDLRNPNVQLILAKAGAFDRAQQRAAELRRSIRAAPPPPVMKPGAAGQIAASRDASDINQIRSELRAAKGNRALAVATKLIKAQRGR